MPENDRLGGGRAARTPTRTVYVWVKDDTTGHEYDVPESSLRKGMTPVKDKPKNHTGRPRPPKHATDLAGKPRTTTAGTADSQAAESKAAVQKGASK